MTIPDYVPVTVYVNRSYPLYALPRVCPHCVHSVAHGEAHEWGVRTGAVCVKGCAACG